jgi:hypothetical protein
MDAWVAEALNRLCRDLVERLYLISIVKRH